MARITHLQRKIRERLEGLEHRQALRNQAHAFNAEHLMVLSALRKSLMPTLEAAKKFAGECGIGWHTAPGPMNTTRLVFRTGDCVMFAHNGDLMGRLPYRIMTPPESWNGYLGK